jgi:hypothetical protein
VAVAVAVAVVAVVVVASRRLYFLYRDRNIINNLSMLHSLCYRLVHQSVNH